MVLFVVARLLASHAHVLVVTRCHMVLWVDALALHAAATPRVAIGIVTRVFSHSFLFFLTTVVAPVALTLLSMEVALVAIAGFQLIDSLLQLAKVQL
eukprot:CAMPEP_0185601796 /NCGR_PEP_ID=MMETSP0436-20130131/1333_1 /TAXON_ID=626734 ORGANISM="Favella taraikaensis, Strain Fe Narragansett Bay" /NCGR_SAMPLE_ID=MMETSP0436 /ASSEMBLY_ACC=CAM_ASM_000390 /LENGTH=96 /DNA_ID=CAMNT_0028231801 /DNA_START=636 /DNA_END=926 /DNA_ORIENTATION=+